MKLYQALPGVSENPLALLSLKPRSKGCSTTIAENHKKGVGENKDIRPSSVDPTSRRVDSSYPTIHLTKKALTRKYRVKTFRPPVTTVSEPASELSCHKCGEKGRIDRHHVIYTPELKVDYIVPLCRYCHARITGLNTKASHVYKPYRKLTREQRLFIFFNIFMVRDWKEKKRLSKKEIRELLDKEGLL
jgi:hypothetical protein